MYLRRARREIRNRVHSEWEREGKWRPRWWTPLILWGGAIFGVCLLTWGNDTFDSVVGVGMLMGPAVIAGITIWVYWKALRILRKERRATP
jgi:hypothetical protein